VPSIRELAARIQNVLRRSAPVPERQSISLPEMRVRAGGQTHDLSRGETELLAVLLEHAPTPLPIAVLTEILGAPRGTVESRIESVRSKLGPGRLVSRGSLGYQLVDE
jgi:DNA-binding response OmpR family regulator